MLPRPEDNVNLARGLRDQIRSYIDGRSTLPALRGWLADHVQRIADSGDPDIDALDGLTWALLSEFDYGHRDEDSIRAELRRALSTTESPVASVPN